VASNNAASGNGVGINMSDDLGIALADLTGLGVYDNVVAGSGGSGPGAQGIS
jgi:hypothetical protein